MGHGGRKHNREPQQDQTFYLQESALSKAAVRGNLQRRLLLKNGEDNISRYIINNAIRSHTFICMYMDSTTF